MALLEKKPLKFAALLLVTVSLTQISACSHRKDYYTSDPSSYKGHLKVGTPYKVDGDWYYPKVDPYYDEIGVASWYGPNFHGKRTANGDVFDEDALTAAHKTLPLPSMVKVTNLSNNRSTVLMVNDRGPYSNGRILDVSKRAAEILGFRMNGTAKVRVEYLPAHTNQMRADLGIQKEGDTYDIATASRIATGKPFNTASSASPASPTSPATSTSATSQNFASQIRESITPNQLGTAPARLPAQTLSKNEMAETGDFDQHYGYQPQLSQSAGRNTLPAGSQAKEASAPIEQAIADNDAATGATPTVPYSPTRAAVAPPPGIYIQVGSYNMHDNANKKAKQLLSFGTTRIIPVELNQMVFYRVRLGPFATKSEAESMLITLEESGHTGGRIIAN